MLPGAVKKTSQSGKVDRPGHNNYATVVVAAVVVVFVLLLLLLFS